MEKINQIEFCDDIWRIIIEYTGWNYHFNLYKLGINKLHKIFKSNFQISIKNIYTRISVEEKKYIIIKTIYQKLRTQASKNIYDNICSHFEKKKKIKTVFDERLCIGDEVVFCKNSTHDPFLAGIITKISDKNTIITIKPYVYIMIPNYHDNQNDLWGYTIYIYDKTNFNPHIKMGTKSFLKNRELCMIDGFNSFLENFNYGKKCSYFNDM
jgi:hypothetical protein